MTRTRMHWHKVVWEASLRKVNKEWREFSLYRRVACRDVDMHVSHGAVIYAVELLPVNANVKFQSSRGAWNISESAAQLAIFFICISFLFFFKQKKRCFKAVSTSAEPEKKNKQK